MRSRPVSGIGYGKLTSFFPGPSFAKEAEHRRRVERLALARRGSMTARDVTLFELFALGEPVDG